MSTQQIVSGDTLSQSITAPLDVDAVSYPASAGWTLTYRFVPRDAGHTVRQVDCVADGDDYLLTVSAADTAIWQAGYYSVSAYVTLGTESYTVRPAYDQLEVQQNPRTAVAGFDGRSQAQKALDDAKKALADAQARAANVGTTGSASSGLIEYSIGERRFKYASATEAVQSMIAAVSFWEVEVARDVRADAIRRGMADPRKVYVRCHRA